MRSCWSVLSFSSFDVPEKGKERLPWPLVTLQLRFDRSQIRTRRIEQWTLAVKRCYIIGLYIYYTGTDFLCFWNARVLSFIFFSFLIFNFFRPSFSFFLSLYSFFLKGRVAHHPPQAQAYRSPCYAFVYVRTRYTWANMILRRIYDSFENDETFSFFLSFSPSLSPYLSRGEFKCAIDSRYRRRIEYSKTWHDITWK